MSHGNAFVKYDFCKVCGKPRNDTFWDKSNYRPLCSSKCYSDYYDELDRQNKITKSDQQPRREKYVRPPEYYKQGRLILPNYNLSRIW